MKEYEGQQPWRPGEWPGPLSYLLGPTPEPRLDNGRPALLAAVLALFIVLLVAALILAPPATTITGGS